MAGVAVSQVVHSLNCGCRRPHAQRHPTARRPRGGLWMNLWKLWITRPSGAIA